MLVDTNEAKAQLSRLTERAAAGEEIIIGRASKPVARLVAYRPGRSPRRAGAWKGQVTMAPDDLVGVAIASGFEPLDITDSHAASAAAAHQPSRADAQSGGPADGAGHEGFGPPAGLHQGTSERQLGGYGGRQDAAGAVGLRLR